MCVVCNLTNQGYETAYLAVTNESSESMLVPVVNKMLELHSFQIIESFLIREVFFLSLINPGGIVL